MKKYNSPMLQIVGISKKDIIATSLNVTNEYKSTWESLDAGRRFDEWDEGF